MTKPDLLWKELFEKIPEFRQDREFTILSSPENIFKVKRGFTTERKPFALNHSPIKVVSPISKQTTLSLFEETKSPIPKDTVKEASCEFDLHSSELSET